MEQLLKATQNELKKLLILQQLQQEKAVLASSTCSACVRAHWGAGKAGDFTKRILPDACRKKKPPSDHQFAWQRATATTELGERGGNARSLMEQEVRPNVCLAQSTATRHDAQGEVKP